ncbi:SPARC-like protein 1 [Pezoporus wallicus]|uniref:SPARC-like protein 1 n=1 Tax=Pezoporus wallicus TaxID=35540 RepID=UPI002549F160|nr:SPARC-like protein 1 [Pezoporus wallicus]XP_061336008.1 SPARC-like protein 1 [Pezoporus flaviventris]
MKAVALFICLVGPAFAIPSHPLNYKLRNHGQKTLEKAEDTHLEASKEEITGHADNSDLVPSFKSLNPEVSVPDAEHIGELQSTRKQGRTGSEHQVKNALKSINFLVMHNKPGLASNKQDSDSGSSSRQQSSSEHYQFRRQEKHSNTAKPHVLGNAENPMDALSLDHEHNTWKYNKNTVGLSEKNSESDEEHVEEEEEEWGEETDYIDTNYKGYQTNQGNQHKIQQNENSMQSDESLRDSSQPIQTAKRHGEKFDLEEEERKKGQKRPYKEEILSQKPRNENQDDKWQSQEKKDDIQVNYQSDHNTVVNRQDIEDGNVDDDGHDSGDVDSEEYLSNTWKAAAYEEEERIHSNEQESTSTEHEREETTKDNTAVFRETEDYKDVKIKDLINSEQDDYDYAPPNSDSNQQLEITSSVQSMNSMEREDKVKSTRGSYGKMESASNRTEEAFLDPCRNFHCKRGKVCHVDKQGKLSCICQDPTACPSTKDYEHVCGTDNKTYDGICQLFGTKCQLEGTKMGRQLHLDYLGSCKYIPHCTDYEVDQFPLRMRDWLKNILMQYYERDLDTSGFLTEKQRNKVKKIYENDKRLTAGNHAVELLLHDFEKNYHMYVYPVHWQFHQLDQHPVDRLLTHSELAPLRASLVPMEHCITRFFQECDGDRDKLIALKEWCHCFGIKEEDINENLLF